MKVLFTGASSFTGFWFVRELAGAGHEVVAVFRRPLEKYTDIVRRERIERLQPICRPIWGAAFGAPAFLDVIESEPAWDLLCHHAAEVGNYRDPEFDVAAALASNIRNAQAVLRGLASRGCRGVVLTGSVFEAGEGAGADQALPAVSPYGLAKWLTAQTFRFYLTQAGLTMGKFVIANPFGPYEERRFTAYLMERWFRNETATVRTPAYVRDNIHVSLLARAYLRFIENMNASDGRFLKLSPSGYVGSQGEFARRVAQEVRARTGLPCDLDLTEQRDFPEPRVRVNTDRLEPSTLGWNERHAWDEFTSYYSQRLG